MLEPVLTRADVGLVRAAQRLRFLFFDRLHTYRGRKGSGQSQFSLPCRFAFGNTTSFCIGTSAERWRVAGQSRAEGSGRHK